MVTDSECAISLQFHKITQEKSIFGSLFYSIIHPFKKKILSEG